MKLKSAGTLNQGRARRQQLREEGLNKQHLADNMQLSEDRAKNGSPSKAVSRIQTKVDHLRSKGQSNIFPSGAPNSHKTSGRLGVQHGYPREGKGTAQSAKQLNPKRAGTQVQSSTT